jgi:hypothetical protein
MKANQKKRTTNHIKGKNISAKSTKKKDNLAIILSIVLFAILAISGITFNIIETINRDKEITSLNEQVTSLKESVNTLLKSEEGLIEEGAE